MLQCPSNQQGDVDGHLHADEAAARPGAAPTLDDGSVWRQTDLERLSPYPKAGSKADSRKAALGSYVMNLDGQRALRVERAR